MMHLDKVGLKVGFSAEYLLKHRGRKRLAQAVQKDTAKTSIQTLTTYTKQFVV